MDISLNADYKTCKTIFQIIEKCAIDERNKIMKDTSYYRH